MMCHVLRGERCEAAPSECNLASVIIQDLFLIAFLCLQVDLDFSLKKGGELGKNTVYLLSAIRFRKIT